MKKIILVKTYSENKDEGKKYLEYNGYGKVLRVLNTDYYICIGSEQHVHLKDVEII